MSTKNPTEERNTW